MAVDDKRSLICATVIIGGVMRVFLWSVDWRHNQCGVMRGNVPPFRIRAMAASIASEESVS